MDRQRDIQLGRRTDRCIGKRSTCDYFYCDGRVRSQLQYILRFLWVKTLTSCSSNCEYSANCFYESTSFIKILLRTDRKENANFRNYFNVRIHEMWSSVSTICAHLGWTHIVTRGPVGHIFKLLLIGEAWDKMVYLNNLIEHVQLYLHPPSRPFQAWNGSAFYYADIFCFLKQIQPLDTG